MQRRQSLLPARILHSPSAAAFGALLLGPTKGSECNGVVSVCSARFLHSPSVLLGLDGASLRYFQAISFVPSE